MRLEDCLLRRGDFTLTADITIPRGVTAVMGPSGGGKSTLLDLVAGFVLPDTGRILWQGREVTRLPPGERPVATLFQDNNLFPHLDALENVVLGLTTAPRPDGTSLERARSALATVGLAGFEDRRSGDLSGGQQGRVALARTILSNREVICLDEPFSALGPALAREMLDLVAHHLGDRHVLLVTHDPDDARRISEHTILVAEGTVSAPQDTGALFADPPPALARYLGEGSD